MKILRWMLVFCFILGLGFNALADDLSDFRRTYWGMSNEDVKAAETEELVVESEERLEYSSSYAGAECIIFYEFSKYDELFRAGYSLPFDDGGLAISKFLHIQDIFESYFGEPSAISVKWLTSYYQDTYGKEKELLYYAFKMGYATILINWDDEPEHQIAFAYFKRDNQFYIHIVHENPKLKPRE